MAQLDVWKDGTRDDDKMNSSIRVFVRNLCGRSVACDVDKDSAIADLLAMLEVGLLSRVK